MSEEKKTQLSEAFYAQRRHSCFGENEHNN